MVAIKQKLQFPPQIGAYKVVPKSEQSTHSWSDFNSVRLQISVGQPYHEGEKFIATLLWVKDRFKNVTIYVNDTLQRYNYIFEQNMSEEEAYISAKKDGQKWLDKYLPVIKKLIPHAEVIRWDQNLSRPDFEERSKQIASFYSASEDFKKYVDQTTLEKWRSKQKQQPNLYFDDRYGCFADLSRKYLLEEISVFSLLFKERKAIDVYPGSVLYPVVAFQNANYKNVPEGLGQGAFCRIDFSKNKVANQNMRI